MIVLLSVLLVLTILFVGKISYYPTSDTHDITYHSYSGFCEMYLLHGKDYAFYEYDLTIIFNYCMMLRVDWVITWKPVPNSSRSNWMSVDRYSMTNYKSRHFKWYIYRNPLKIERKQ